MGTPAALTQIGRVGETPEHGPASATLLEASLDRDADGGPVTRPS